MAPENSGRQSTRRRLRLLIAAVTAIVALVVVAGCGGGSSSGGSGGGGESGKESGFKAAVLTPGTANDGSWGEAVAEGAEAAAKKFGAKVTIAANLEETAQYQQQGLALAQAGYNLIICANSSMASVIEELAKKFPNTKFGQVAVSINPLQPNISTSTPEFPTGTFQAGVLAGLMTKTGTVGTVGGFEFPTLNSEMEGFALGARYADPKVKVLRTFINTWTDASKAKAAAQAQASQGADIVFSATDQATQGMFQLAESGSSPLKYVIPQYLDKASQAPNVVLTTSVYNLQGATGSFIEMYGEGKWKSQNVTLGIEDGVGLEPNPAMESVIPPEVQKKLEEIEKKIETGELKVPTWEELGESGSAEKVDLKSLES